MRKFVISMLGEKDHGKSTLLGNMLIATGSTTEARISEVRKMAKKRFEPAYILDSFAEERENEMTIDTTRASVVYKKDIFEFIDVPGHLELIKNMLSGASNGDMAILLVSAKREEGFRPQTRRHLYLSNMLGINALVVAVNKLDTVGYDKAVFDRVCMEVGRYLGDIGFEKPVHFVPISAYNNENLVKGSKNFPWYKGRPLLDTVVDFAHRHVGARKEAAGLRMLVQDVIGSGRDADVFGMIHNGSIRVGERVRVEPSGIGAKVTALHVKGKAAKSAKTGINVALKLDKDAGVKRGSVVYDSGSRPRHKNLVGVRIFLIQGIDPGSAKGITLKVNNNEILLSKIAAEEVISPISGKHTHYGGGRIAANSAINAKLSLKDDYPFERFDSFRELGRFAVYMGGEFIGIGVVT